MPSARPSRSSPATGTRIRELGNFLFRHGRYVAAAPAATGAWRSSSPPAPWPSTTWGRRWRCRATSRAPPPRSSARWRWSRRAARTPTSGTDYYFLGRYAEAAGMYTHATQLAPGTTVSGATSPTRCGRSQAAAPRRSRTTAAPAELAQRGLEVNSQDAVSWMQLAYYRARAGDTEHIGQLRRARARPGRGRCQRAVLRGTHRAAARRQRRGPRGADPAVRLGYPPQLVSAAPDFTEPAGRCALQACSRPRLASHRKSDAADHIRRRTMPDIEPARPPSR